LGGTKKDGIYRKIAQIHAADRDHLSAIGYLEKAASYAEQNRGEFPPDTLWLEAAGVALEMDDPRSAISYVRKALAHNPQNRVAKERLEQLSRVEEDRP
jgi:tetratricopeptide (TPR) repeat protein